MKLSSTTTSTEEMKVPERSLVVTLAAPKRLMESLQELLTARFEECEDCPDVDVRTQSYTIAKDGLVVWAIDARARQADHLISSVVLFIAEEPTELQLVYLSWIDECGGRLAKEQCKPVAFATLTKDSLTKEWFVTQSLGSPAGGGKYDRKSFEKEAFERLDVLYQDTHKEFVAFSSSSIKDIAATLTIAKRFRQAHGFFWSREDTSRIQESFKSHSRDHTSDRFSLASTLGESHPGLAVDGDVHSALLKDARVTPDRQSRNRIISSYLILHTRRVYPRSYDWLGCKIKQKGTRLQNHFAEHYFNFRFRDPLRTLLRKTDGSCPELVEPVLEMWMEDMAKDGGDQENSSSLAKHLANLQDHATILQGRDFGRACFACLCRDWSALLPCSKHGLCNDCLMALDGSWATYGGALVTVCNICGQRFKDWRGRVNPPNFTPSVLSLDGGGVRGLIQLEVLRLLKEEIAIDIPLFRFFDLIVGTSIGGIIGLGLGLRGWSIEEGQQRLKSLAQEVFLRPGALSRFCPKVDGWLTTFQKIWSFLRNSAIYDSSVLEGVLKRSFGETEMLLGSWPVNVAVTTTAWNPRLQLRTLLTSYNPSSRCPMKLPYTRRNMNDHGKAIRVWEAARCTSAAPGYFKPVSLSPSDESRFVDGGVSHNNPASIALREASDLYACQLKDVLVTSVGCGRLNLVPESNDIFRQLIHSFYIKTSPAQEEEDRSVWGHQEKYTRVDPFIDINNISLDDISSMESLLPQLQREMSENSDLHKRLVDAKWKIFANSFFCLPDSVSGQCTVYNRLGLEVEKIIAKYKDLELVILLDEAVQFCYKLDHSSFPVRIRLPEGARVDVKLHSENNKKTQSISGFPIEKKSASLNRKRKFEHAN